MRARGGWSGLILGLGVVAAVALLTTATVVALRWDREGLAAATTTPRSTTSSPAAEPHRPTGDEGGEGDEPAPPLDPLDAEAGELAWREVAAGFETAELAVVLGGEEVDKILLSRFDPARFRFEVVNEPATDRTVVDWLDVTGATLVVNGSYYDPDGQPVTPIVSENLVGGPSSYEAAHGAFVAATAGGAETATVVDLAGVDWRDAVAGAHDAMVSYPLLVGADGPPRTGPTDPGQRANRTFVATDGAGRIVVGTTIRAFFSLDGLGRFLAAGPLGPVVALNLDGGPLACQAWRSADQHREYCGQFDVERRDGRLEVAEPDPDEPRPALPIVLLIRPRPEG